MTTVELKPINKYTESSLRPKELPCFENIPLKFIFPIFFPFPVWLTASTNSNSNTRAPRTPPGHSSGAQGGSTTRWPRVQLQLQSRAVPAGDPPGRRAAARKGDADVTHYYRKTWFTNTFIFQYGIGTETEMFFRKTDQLRAALHSNSITILGNTSPKRAWKKPWSMRLCFSDTVRCLTS